MGYSMEGGGGMGDKVAEARVGRMSHVGHFRREIALTLLHPLGEGGSRPSLNVVAADGVVDDRDKQQIVPSFSPP